jgi:hypothetical protein
MPWLGSPAWPNGDHFSLYFFPPSIIHYRLSVVSLLSFTYIIPTPTFHYSHHATSWKVAGSRSEMIFFLFI